MNSFDAHKLLVQNGFEVLKNSPYKIPIVCGRKYEEVESLLRESGYQGSFGVINEKKNYKETE